MEKINNYNKYENALIMDGVNPKVCYMSNKNSEYLDILKNKYGANITILGIKPERIDLSIFRNCDIIILETDKGFSDSLYNFIIDLGNVISYKEDRNVSMVYSFNNLDGSTKICSYNSVSWMYKDLDSIDGYFESRDLLDIGMRAYLNFEKEKSFVKSYK